MVPLFFCEHSQGVDIRFLSFWLDIRSLVTLDVAVLSETSRPYWVTLLQSVLSSYPQLGPQSLVLAVADKMRDQRYEIADEG